LIIREGVSKRIGKTPHRIRKEEEESGIQILCIGDRKPTDPHLLDGISPVLRFPPFLPGMVYS
jgi:hypothetical protein